MSNLYHLFGTDQDLEQQGFCLEYGSAQFVIARAGGSNNKYQRLLERKLRPYRSAINAGTMDEDLTKRLLAESYAEGIILAWDGVTDTDGNDLPFTKENVVKLLIDLPDLFTEIIQESQRISNFVRVAAEEDAKD